MNPPMAGRLILIVENEPLVALQMTLAFEDEGAWVTRACNLKDALDQVENPELSAAILEHELSDGDTSTVCKRMSERNIPFITYSRHEPSNGAARGGVHVKKPVGMPELVAIVKRAMAERLVSGPQQEAGVIHAPAPSTLRRTLHLS
jgi:DNA-binding response OmpR family regulator